MVALLDLARRHDRQVHVPATVLAQVWRGGLREHGRDVIVTSDPDDLRRLDPQAELAVL